MTATMTRPRLYTWGAVRPLIRHITFRQIDYWLRAGGIYIANSADGSGSRRRFSDLDVRRLIALDAVWPALAGLAGNAGVRHSIITVIWRALEVEPWPTHLVLSAGPFGGWSVGAPRADETALRIPLRHTVLDAAADRSER